MRKWILHNESDQRYVARIYIGLALALFLRPSTGAILINLEELTIFDRHTIMLIFVGLFGYLRRAYPIHLLKYIMLLLPLAFFTAYIISYVLTNTESTIFSGVFIIMCWYTIVKNLGIAIETRQ